MRGCHKRLADKPCRSRVRTAKRRPPSRARDRRETRGWIARRRGWSRSTADTMRAPIENNLIDELVASELDRQEFIRRAAMFGLGAGTIGALLRFVGEPDLAFGAPAAPAKRGGTLRVGNLKPAKAIDPITSNTQAVLAATSITGEYLLFTDPRNNALRPVLATSYKPDKTGKRWTFQIRKGVKFHDGARDDGRRRGRDLQAAHRSQECLGSAVGVQGRAVARRNTKNRTATPLSSFWMPRRRASRTSSARPRIRRSSCPRGTRSARTRRPSSRARGRTSFRATRRA